jgi:molybdenum cofactor synthesis domain-containing protein
MLSIGNELLLGNTVNTNASWIATQVTSLGGRVSRITTVGDNLEDISTALREAIKRGPDFLITTGGIGPTFDDMTMKAVAKALRMRLKADKAAVAMVREHYARRFPRRRTKLTKPRLKMATIPSGGVPVRNPIGTAPGVKISMHRTEIFCLPGVPREAEAIFNDTLSGLISAKAGGMRFAEKWVKVQGVMESSLAPVIDRVMRECPGVYIKSHPRSGESGGRPFIELHFSISSPNPRKAEQTLLSAVGKTVRDLSDMGGMIERI